MKMTETVPEQTKIKVYYMHQQDGMSRLSPILLLDGGRVWQASVKRKPNGVDMYYLFLDDSVYVKLWKDKHGNLLLNVNNVADPIFFSPEKPDVFSIDVALSYLRWDDEAIYYGNEKKVEFSIPVIGVVQRLNPWATRPLVYLLFQMFAYTSPPAAASTPAGADAESTPQNV